MSSFQAYARAYDLLYRGKDYAGEARFIDRQLRDLGVAGDATLLDIGCGTGAHARQLVSLGWRVTGMDLSADMIALARERTPTAAGIDFHVGSATRFELGRRFAAVTSLFHVTSYLIEPGEVAALFQGVRRHLAPGGIFAFDFWHRPGVLADPPVIRVRREADDAVALLRVAEPTFDPATGRVDVRYNVYLEPKKSGGAIEHIEEVHRLRAYAREELEPQLRAAGFEVCRAYQGLSDKPLDEQAWYGLILARAT